ncbi:MAG TPA: hypothetical protein VNX66_04005 [Candidatus Sulfotelmatobacter sp.]|nr:hypothetical protein [Candidatus Sulfotelmatobacter sp.]
MKTHAKKHLVVPVFFNEPADLTGFTEGKPGAGRIFAIKSVIYSDGSTKRWYKVGARKKNSKRKKRVK